MKKSGFMNNKRQWVITTPVYDPVSNGPIQAEFITTSDYDVIQRLKAYGYTWSPDLEMWTRQQPVSKQSAQQIDQATAV